MGNRQVKIPLILYNISHPYIPRITPKDKPNQPFVCCLWVR